MQHGHSFWFNQGLLGVAGDEQPDAREGQKSGETRNMSLMRGKS